MYYMYVWYYYSAGSPTSCDHTSGIPSLGLIILTSFSLLVLISRTGQQSLEWHTLTHTYPCYSSLHMDSRDPKTHFRLRTTTHEVFRSRPCYHPRSPRPLRSPCPPRSLSTSPISANNFLQQRKNEKPGETVRAVQVVDSCILAEN